MADTVSDFIIQRLSEWQVTKIYGYPGDGVNGLTSSTKGAINAFTKTLAMELAEKGIRVNAVAPGPVWTPLNTADEGQPAKKVREFGKNTMFERPAEPEEIAPAYVFLASEADSSFITGIVLPQMGKTTAG